MTTYPERGGSLARVLAGQPVDRRVFLRAAGLVTLGLTLPGGLTACGTTTSVPKNDNYEIIDTGVLSYVDLERLIAAYAPKRGMAPSLTRMGYSNVTEGLRQMTVRSPVFDPATNRYPDVSNLLVVPTIDAGAAEPVLKIAIARGVKIVSYPHAAKHRTAAIIIDPAASASMLAAHAGDWAGRHITGSSQALLVLPSDRAEEANSTYGSSSAAIERAFRSGLAKNVPSIGVAQVVRTQPFAGDGADDVTAALDAHPDVHVVLVWNDDTAIGIAAALRHGLPRAKRAKLYVGGIGAPVLTSRATLDELDKNDVLRAVAAPRLRDLARAMVDVPYAVINQNSTSDLILTPELLTPNSSGLASFKHDYTRNPVEPPYERIDDTTVKLVTPPLAPTYDPIAPPKPTTTIPDPSAG